MSVCGSVCLSVTLLGDKRASLSDETVSSSAIIKTSGLDWMKFDPSAVSVRYLLPFVNFGGGRE